MLVAIIVIVLALCASETLRGAGVGSAGVKSRVDSDPLLGVHFGEECLWDRRLTSTRNVMGELEKSLRPPQDSCDQQDFLAS